jgi:hypothetical protein
MRLARHPCVRERRRSKRPHNRLSLASGEHGFRIARDRSRFTKNWKFRLLRLTWPVRYATVAAKPVEWLKLYGGDH